MNQIDYAERQSPTELSKHGFELRSTATAFDISGKNWVRKPASPTPKRNPPFGGNVDGGREET